MTINEAVVTRLLKVVDAGLTSGLGSRKPGDMCVEAAVCYALDLPHSDDPKCVSLALRSLKIRLNDSKWSSNAARSKGLRKLAVAQLGSLNVLDETEFLKRVQTMTIRVIVPIAFREAAKRLKEPHKQTLLDHALKCEAEPTVENLSAAKSAAAAADAACAAYAAAADATDAIYAAAYAAAYTAAYATYTAIYAANSATDAAAATDAAVYADAAAYADAAYDAAASAADYARDKVLTLFADEILKILIDMKAPGCQWLYLCE